MISATSLFYISFINIFMIPIIGVRVYYKRHDIKWKISSDFLFYYILIAVLNLLLVRVVGLLIEKVLANVITVESIKYTLIALICSIAIPYIMEVIEKYIKVDVEITCMDKRGKQNES